MNIPPSEGTPRPSPIRATQEDRPSTPRSPTGLVLPESAHRQVLLERRRRSAAAEQPNVTVGPFRVADRGYRALVRDLVSGSISNALGAGLRRQSAAVGPAPDVRRASDRPFIAYALHVGGLNAQRNTQFVAAMSTADAVYADGTSVVLLAKLAHGRRVERSGTTDLAWDVLRELSATLGRPARVALIGGAPGLAARAGTVLEDAAAVEVVLAEHGYHQEWKPVLARLSAAGADVVIVGLGAPREMLWVEEHRDDLPNALVITCGGWFGFLASVEKRAPVWMQHAGLEWSYRVMQAPGRLASRYALGVLTALRLAVLIAAKRTRRRDGPVPD